MTRAQAVIGQAEIGIERDRAVKAFDRRIAIVRRYRAKDKTRKAIAAAQVSS